MRNIIIETSLRDCGHTRWKLDEEVRSSLKLSYLPLVSPTCRVHASNSPSKSPARFALVSRCMCTYVRMFAREERDSRGVHESAPTQESSISVRNKRVDGGGSNKSARKEPRVRSAREFLGETARRSTYISTRRGHISNASYLFILSPALARARGESRSGD